MLLKRYTLIFVFLFALTAYATEEAVNVFVYDDFSGGLNSYANPYRVPKKQGTIFQNLRIGKQFGSLVKRDKYFSYGTVGSYALNNIFRYYKNTDDTKKLLARYSTKLAYGSDSAGTFTTIHDGLTDGAWANYVTYKDNCIIIPAGEQPLKYDGHTQVTANTDGSRTASYLCAELGAPFVELNTGTNLDNASWYAYIIAHFNSSTAIYQYSTAISNTILTGGAVYDCSLTDIPLGASGTTSRLVYRTEGASSRANLLIALAAEELYQVDELTNNTATTFADTVTDDTLDDDATPTWATVSAGVDMTPPTSKYACLTDQRLFLAGNSTNASRLYWSEIYKPDLFKTSTQNRDIQPDDGDEITGIIPFLGLLHTFKTNSIQKHYTEGKPDNDWAISDSFTSISTPAPRTIDITPEGIAYLTWDGLYLFDGQYVKNISDGITDVISDISKANIGTTVGKYINNKYYLAYASSATGSTQNNRVLVYDFKKDAYVIDTAEISCFAGFDSGSDTNVLYSGSSDTDGYILAHSGSVGLLRIRYTSDFNNGTFDDAKVIGDEEDPVVDIAWGTTIGDWGSISATIGGFAGNDYIIGREDTDGTWTSEVYQIGASALNKIYWNENLGSYGDITFQVRTGDVATPDVTWESWSTAVSNPSGSDISSVTAGTYIQIRANLSTTVQAFSPTLYSDDNYVIKLDYSITGTAYETTMLSEWAGGWTDLDLPAHKKIIKRIKVFYEATSGILTVNYKNEDNTTDNSFEIDMSIDPLSSSSDNYTGNGDYRIYTYRPLETESPKGQFYQFNISDSGVTSWKIHMMEVLSQRVEIYD